MDTNNEQFIATFKLTKKTYEHTKGDIFNFTDFHDSLGFTTDKKLQ